MKRVIILMLFVFLGTTTFAQGVNFKDRSFAEAVKTAKKEKKLVFIDVYTSWCGPCKHMSAEIFPQPKAGEFFNANFINYKVDAEKSEDGREIAKTYGVSAYPTFLFVNGNGELTYRFMGAKSVDELIVEGQKALEAFAVQPQLEKFAKRFAKGERNIDFLNEYYLLQIKAGLDCSKTLLAYFEQANDEQLFVKENVKRLQNVALYDKAFADRLVQRAMAFGANPNSDKKEVSEIYGQVCKYLSACLTNITTFGTEADFDHVIELKNLFFSVEGNRNSITSAMMSGGAVYLPHQLLQMDYYAGKNIADKYAPVYEKFLVEMDSIFNDVDNAYRQMQESIVTQEAEALKKGNEKEAKQLVTMGKMMLGLINMDKYYIYTAMLENTEKYDNLYLGQKDAAYYDRLMGYYLLIYNYYPHAKTACFVADKLIERERIEDARKVLTQAIELGTAPQDATAEMVEACKTKLAELKN